MARVTLRRGPHVYVGIYRTHAELCVIVLGWAFDVRLNFTMQDAAAILSSHGALCELVK